MVHASPTTTSTRTTITSVTPTETIQEEEDVVATQSASVSFETTTMPMPLSSTQKRYVSEGGVTFPSAGTVDPNIPLNSNGEYFEVPRGHGLLVRLHSEDGSVSITTTPDQNFPEIHTHCYAPACMRDMKLLHGGGSGTAVFGGYHPEMQHIVMKHGSSRDTKEVFSLATIASELIRRQRINGYSSTTPLTAAEAAHDMKKRIPEFVCVYISPFHLRDRGKELWASLRTVTYTPSGRRLSSVTAAVSGNNNNNSIRDSQRLTHDELQKLQKLAKFRPRYSNSSSSSIKNKENNALLKSGVALDLSLPRRIVRVHTGSRARLVEEWCVSFHAVDMYVPALDEHHKIVAHPAEGGGGENEEDRAIRFLQDFCVELMNQEDTHNWKGTTVCLGGTIGFDAFVTDRCGSHLFLFF
jgi:hypothetical protein